jgi:CheY-like chemotaxis protein
VQGDPSALREALTNLVFNAVDALPAGGSITLRTRHHAQHVLVAVQDTGTGMGEEVRRRCLEPFFSTKGGRGTGMGLAMVHGIVRRHNGRLEIATTPGKGTTFRLFLPEGTSEATASTSHEASPEHRGRPLHVLVVDDEPMVRQVTSAYLTVAGHTVQEARTGAEALSHVRTTQFDLVITDAAMPGMSGAQLAPQVKALAPETPLAMLTGFGDLMAAAAECPVGIDLVVGKPVSAEKVTAMLALVP